jgi:3-dehydroquinate synthase
LIEENVAANLAEIIERSVSVKAKVVSSDFRESGEREILNYGHTLGHAIEKDANYDLRHGEAISIGMVFVAALSVELEGLSGEVLDRHKAILKKLGLPLTYKKDAWDRLYSLMLSDKKRKSGEIRFVTLIKEGKCGRKSSPEGILRNVYFKEIGLNL